MFQYGPNYLYCYKEYTIYPIELQWDIHPIFEPGIPYFVATGSNC
jgi:hypothetical protein